MPTSGARPMWMTLFALFLLGTAYGMFKANFLLAGICAAGIILLRVFGLPRLRDDDDGETDADER